ncbi:50S ribosomal protein L5 [SAR202 cluster bacterium AD-804-J14_MRT_500m]|nr:50S ribosomal protein L5 [SAR202 cluster bacterium AD-804-J14_MRT_500m]
MTKSEEDNLETTEKKPPAKGRPRKNPASTSTVKRPSRSRKKDSTQSNGAVRLVGRIEELYAQHVIPTMMREFSYGSVMEVPRLQKVVLNCGVGEAKDNIRALEGATQDLVSISGQKPITTRAKKAIAGFKIREGMPIGTSVTLRGKRMRYFLDRLLNAALPRIRDFRGVPRTSFDGRGNYSLGIREQVIFPEIDFNTIDRIRGMQVTIATSAKTDAEGARLLELLGMPFVRQS